MGLPHPHRCDGRLFEQTLSWSPLVVCGSAVREAAISSRNATQLSHSQVQLQVDDDMIVLLLVWFAGIDLKGVMFPRHEGEVGP